MILSLRHNYFFEFITISTKVYELLVTWQTIIITIKIMVLNNFIFYFSTDINSFELFGSIKIKVIIYNKLSLFVCYNFH